MTSLPLILGGGALFAQNPNPFVYFAGNPAPLRYTIGGTCSNPSRSITYVTFTSGDVFSDGNPARWTALPFHVCAPITFDSISYAPRSGTGVPEIRVFITGSRTGADGRLEPDLNNIIYWTSLGTYPGAPPISGQDDVQIRSYFGATSNLLWLRTSPLGQSLTLGPGVYFAIITGDEDFAQAGPLNSSIPLVMGAPGGPKLYYSPRGLGGTSWNGLIAPASWERYRTDSNTLPCTRSLNTDLPWREQDPFANDPPWNSLPHWNRYHPPQFYLGVLGFRNSQASGGKVTGTVSLSDANVAPSADLLPTVEVIFYLPGTKNRVARFSMPAGPPYAIDTPEVVAGTYDIVVRPIYRPSIFSLNCPTDLCITDVTFSGETHWLGVRIANVNVSGTVDLGSIVLPNGDTNRDLVVDDADLLSVLFAFGSNEPSADLNGDGVVDDADLLIVLFSFGTQGEDGDEDCD